MSGGQWVHFMIIGSVEGAGQLGFMSQGIRGFVGHLLGAAGCRVPRRA